MWFLARDDVKLKLWPGLAFVPGERSRALSDCVIPNKIETKLPQRNPFAAPLLLPKKMTDLKVRGRALAHACWTVRRGRHSHLQQLPTCTTTCKRAIATIRFIRARLKTCMNRIHSRSNSYLIFFLLLTSFMACTIFAIVFECYHCDPPLPKREDRDIASRSVSR